MIRSKCFIYYILIMLFLSGCNDSVFIDKLSVSANEIDFDGTEGEAQIEMSTKDWYVSMITITDGVHYKVLLYDSSGDYVGYVAYTRNWFSKIVLSTEGYELNLFYKDQKSIVIKSGENKTTSPLTIRLLIANDYETPINVFIHVKAGEKTNE